MKKIISISIVTLTLSLLLASCSNSNNNSTSSTDDVSSELISSETTSSDGTITSYTKQFSPPEVGQTIATMSVKGFGDIKIMLFDKEAPKAVENFVTHAENGYYNGVSFHRVINDFMIQGGDPQGTGMGGESIWGKSFEDEFSNSLRNFTGALSMANSGPNTNGSQFFIVNTSQDITEEYISAINQQQKDMGIKETVYTEEQKKQYSEVGGTPHLDNVHTVFGQVFDSMDIVDKISKTPTDPSDKPVEPVVIEKITISKYEG